MLGKDETMPINLEFAMRVMRSCKPHESIPYRMEYRRATMETWRESQKPLADEPHQARYGLRRTLKVESLRQDKAERDFRREHPDWFD